MNRIFLIEDDSNLEGLIVDFLRRYNYEVFTVKDFNNIEKEFYEVNPDLVLLDINLPYYDGFFLCRVFRRKSKLPIIILSARTGEIDQVMGMELGADDYLIKPFSNQVLLAKIKSNIRRVYGEYAQNSTKTLGVKGLILDIDSFKMSSNKKEVEISKNEFKLIKKLMENRDKVVTREELLEELWDDSLFVDDNTLTISVSRIKQRLKDIGIDNPIKTKRGIGYILDSKLIGGGGDV